MEVVVVSDRHIINFCLRSRSFFYNEKEINAEIAHIQRIQALQARAVTLTGTLIMSVFIGYTPAPANARAFVHTHTQA